MCESISGFGVPHAPVRDINIIFVIQLCRGTRPEGLYGTGAAVMFFLFLVIVIVVSATAATAAAFVVVFLLILPSGTEEGREGRHSSSWLLKTTRVRTFPPVDSFDRQRLENTRNQFINL